MDKNLVKNDLPFRRFPTNFLRRRSAPLASESQPYQAPL